MNTRFLLLKYAKTRQRASAISKFFRGYTYGPSLIREMEAKGEGMGRDGWEGKEREREGGEREEKGGREGCHTHCNVWALANLLQAREGEGRGIVEL